MSANEKITVELDGATLKFFLPNDVMTLITDAHERHIDTSDQIGAAAASLELFVSHLFLKGGLEFEMPFRAWLKERLRAVVDHEEFILERYRENRDKYCPDCDELYENCVCYEDEENG